MKYIRYIINNNNAIMVTSCRDELCQSFRSRSKQIIYFILLFILCPPISQICVPAEDKPMITNRPKYAYIYMSLPLERSDCL